MTKRRIMMPVDDDEKETETKTNTKGGPWVGFLLLVTLLPLSKAYIVICSLLESCVPEIAEDRCCCLVVNMLTGFHQEGTKYNLYLPLILFYAEQGIFDKP
ncbi:hypothetical protein B0H19DRAFT_1061250 [Mycena capillaripes]|nr:hypothetical protein B0H19DRAFT_1061250 [Mycena capillaripes]